MSARLNSHAVRQTAGLSFTRREFIELEAFLSHLGGASGSMTADALHGCLTAIALLPTGVAVEQWTILLWGQGRDEPSDSLGPAQEECLNSYLVRVYNDIITALGDPLRTFVPLAVTDDGLGNPGEHWCRGFLQGMALFRESWRAFLADTGCRHLLLPIFLLGAEAIPAKWRSLVSTPEKRAGLAACIPAIVETIATELLILELTTTLKKKEVAIPMDRRGRHPQAGAPSRPTR